MGILESVVVFDLSKCRSVRGEEKNTKITSMQVFMFAPAVVMNYSTVCQSSSIRPHGHLSRKLSDQTVFPKDQMEPML